MKKIPTVFKRDPDNMANVTEEVHPDCQWVLDGEGIATRKYDGTCCYLDENMKWWQRREVKPGKQAPEGFVQVDYDHETGKKVGWVPFDTQGYLHPLSDALDVSDIAATMSRKVPDIFNDVIALASANMKPGTYELCGPKINGNPEGYQKHHLICHDDAQWIRPFNTTYEGLRETVLTLAKHSGFEGIVWHHSDGRMAKLKARDFPEGRVKR